MRIWQDEQIKRRWYGGTLAVAKGELLNMESDVGRVRTRLE